MCSRAKVAYRWPPLQLGAIKFSFQTFTSTAEGCCIRCFMSALATGSHRRVTVSVTGHNTWSSHIYDLHCHSGQYENNSVHAHWLILQMFSVGLFYAWCSLFLNLGRQYLNRRLVSSTRYCTFCINIQLLSRALPCDVVFHMAIPRDFSAQCKSFCEEIKSPLLPLVDPSPVRPDLII